MSIFENRKVQNIVMAITVVLITITGIIFKQDFIRILPLYVSVVVSILQARVSRYASLLGGLNSILYTVVYYHLGMYALAVQSLLFSCPMQLMTFGRWKKKPYGQATIFRKLTAKQRIIGLVLLVIVYLGMNVVLSASGGKYQWLDSLSSLLGISNGILMLLCFVEYTWLIVGAGVSNIFLNIAALQEYPGQITYVIYTVYAVMCTTTALFRVRKLYEIQQKEGIE